MWGHDTAACGEEVLEECREVGSVECAAVGQSGGKELRGPGDHATGCVGPGEGVDVDVEGECTGAAEGGGDE